MSLKLVFVLCASFACFQTSLGAIERVVCYFKSDDAAAFTPEDINVNICTHVNYAFVGINADDATLIFQEDIAILGRVTARKSDNPNFKVLLTVGGFYEDSPSYSKIAADATLSSAFASNVISILEEYNADGLDVDWLYPGQNGGTAADRENLVNLLSVLRNAFGTKYLLSITTSPVPDTTTYDIEGITPLVDFFAILTYDFHTAADGVTGANTPLYSDPSDSEYDRTYSTCEASIRNWINGGAPASKINMGLAFYGQTFQLANPADNGIGAAVIGYGITDGYYGYGTNCQQVAGWTIVHDDYRRVPYKYSEDDWISYDDVQSIGEKVLYAKDRDLGGVMVYALHEDDLTGACGVKYGLMNAIKDHL